MMRLRRAVTNTTSLRQVHDTSTDRQTDTVETDRQIYRRRQTDIQTDTKTNTNS